MAACGPCIICLIIISLTYETTCASKTEYNLRIALEEKKCM